MRRHRVVVLIVGALIAASSACGSGTQRVTSEPPVSSTDASTTTTTTTAPPTTAAPTARNQLSPFIDAALLTDARLRAAATAINGTGPPWSEVTESVAAAVTAARPPSLVTTLPAGLPHDLLQQTVLVQSELVSRWYAMHAFGVAWEIPADQLEASDADLLQRLGNGHEAAMRFPADLEQLQAMAIASPAIVPGAPTSRAAAEVALYEDFINKVNGGCDSSGGQRVTTLPELVWQDADDPSGYHFDGTISGIPFIATLVNGTWTVTIWAC